MKKYILILFCNLFIAFNCTAHETIIIDNDAFKLEIQQLDRDTTYYFNVETTEDNREIGLKAHASLLFTVTNWLKKMELDILEYEILGLKAGQGYDVFYDSTLFYNKVFKVELIHKKDEDLVQNYRLAFEQFARAIGLKSTIERRNIPHWEIKVFEENSTAISVDQNSFWKRTEYEAYIYYERINLTRIADLLSRKLDNYVRPVIINDVKFDIKMPYSKDIFDLKYSMIEHGLALEEVTEEIEVWVINFE